MRILKKIGITVGVLFAVIQFIQPAHNHSGQVLATDFARIYSAPQKVQSILWNACYDCHSDVTNYPWYSYVQPVGWMTAKHIKDGKEKLNFSEFGGYSPRRQISKLKGAANSIKDGIMPIASYKMMHRKALSTQEDKILIIGWLQRTADSLSTIY